MGILLNSSVAASTIFFKKIGPAYFLADLDACIMTGLFNSFAPSIIALICSKLLTLNAGTP